MPFEWRHKFLECIKEKTGNDCGEKAIPICDCKSIDEFPDLVFKLDFVNYFVPKESYVFKDYIGYCELGLMSHEDIDVWIFGLNFFENYYTVFDQENYRVGFAPSVTAEKRVYELIE